MGEIIIEVGDGEQPEVFGYIPTPPHPPVDEPPVVVPTPTPGPTPTPVPAPAPEPEPDLGEGLPDSTLLALLLVALGLAAAAKALADFFNWLMRKMLGPLWPRAGSPSVTPEDVTQPLTNALGQQLAGVDAELGVSFTKLAQLVAQAGAWVKTESQLLWTLAQRQTAAEGALSASTARQNAIGAQADHAAAQAAEATQAAQTAQQQAAQTAQTVQTELGAVTTHITTVIDPELEQLRHLIPELQNGVSTAWDEITQHSEALGLAGLTAGVATALGRLGAGWTTCDTTSSIGRELCGPTGVRLARLLRGGLPLLAFGDLCLTLKAASALMQSGPIQGSLELGADGIAGLMHCASAEGADPLRSAYYAPGPRTALGAPGAVASTA